MIRAVVLDSGPLGLVTKARGVPEAELCRDWVRRCATQQVSILVPAIAYYEVGRELERLNNAAGLRRLDSFCTAAPNAIFL